MRFVYFLVVLAPAAAVTYWFARTKVSARADRRLEHRRHVAELEETNRELDALNDRLREKEYRR